MVETDEQLVGIETGPVVRSYDHILTISQTEKHIKHPQIKPRRHYQPPPRSKLLNQSTMAITRSRSKQQKKGVSTGGAAKRPAKKKVRTKAKQNRGSKIPVSQTLPSAEKIASMLHRVVDIGGLVSPECLDYHPMREGLLKMLNSNSLSKNPKLQIWIYRQVETLCDVRDKGLIENTFGGFKDVPVLIIVCCEVEPISYYASCSTQVQSSSFSDFQEKSLKWTKVLPRVNFLQTTQRPQFLFGSAPSTVQLSFEYAILPTRRPTQLANLVPDEVEFVSIVYKGTDITASKKSQVDAIIEVEPGLTEEEDRERIIALLKAEKKKDQQANQEFVDAEKRRHGEMIDSLAEANSMDRATVETKLEDMKVYKIYPSSIPDQRVTWIGLKTGFDTSNAKINRFVGNADEVYS